MTECKIDLLGCEAYGMVCDARAQLDMIDESRGHIDRALNEMKYLSLSFMTR